MQLTLSEKHKFFNLLLAALYALGTCGQLALASTAPSPGFHFAMAALLGFLAFSIQRATPWAYWAAFILALISVIGVLNNLSTLGMLSLIALPIAAGTAWLCLFLRKNIIVNTNDQHNESSSSEH